MKLHTLFFFFSILYFYSFNIIGKELWVLDKSLSTIEFELPVLFAENVKGKFNEIEGLIELDINDKEKNKAIFSVKIDSLEINYKKYKKLLFSNIFFDSFNYPIALIDTKKFSYKNKNELKFPIELNIKGIVRMVPLELKIVRLAVDLVQIQANLKFSRNLFEIGTGKWKSTAILKDNATIKADLFLFRK